MFPITSYNNFPEKFYFLKIIDDITKIGKLKNTKKIVLDFGCGNKIFSKKIPKIKILNYDVNPKFSEIKHYKNYKFDIVIFNHVLMHIEKKYIKSLFLDLYKINPKLIFLIGVGKQNLFSKIGKFILGRNKSHDQTFSSYDEQLSLIKKYMTIRKKKNVFYLTDIFYCSFKKILG